MKTGDYLILSNAPGKMVRTILNGMKIPAWAFNPTDGDKRHCPVIIPAATDEYLADIKAILDKKDITARFFKLEEVEVITGEEEYQPGKKLAGFIKDLVDEELGG
jgi:hypothetical protein